MRVLIVEDKEENAYYLKALFEGHGWNTDCARHGAEALVKARLALPDVVISDLLMPVMDGYTLLRHWKSDERLKPVPFVVYTATYTEQDDERLALSLGADRFLLKPAEPEAMLACVTEVCAPGAAINAGAPRVSLEGKGKGEGEVDLLKLYSETLIRKLEEKTIQLEEANRALRQEQDELRIRDTAMQAIAQGIVITDPHQPDNPIVYASSSFLRMTGYEAAEVIGRNCRFLRHEQTDAESLAKVRQAIRDVVPCEVEMLNKRKDGSQFWNSLSISPVTDSLGQLIHFIGVQTDVTEHKRLDEQLRQAKKMEAVGQLAAGVAHDFNNILSVILSYSQFALEQLSAGDPLRSDVEEILRAGERATDLTQQLLAFSRQQVRQPRVVDLGEIVGGLEKMLKRLIGEDIELSLLIAPQAARVHADPSQIEQIILNLAVNARDAMPTGGKLTLETAAVVLDEAHAAMHHGVKPGAYALLAVTDTGSGIDPQTKDRIFEPFFSTKPKGKGTGLGLSTVFGIVKQSGGHVWVYSEPGQGAAFKVYLPRVERELEAAVEQAADPRTLRGTETVLLVEDDAQVRTMALTVLRRRGYTVLDAQNGGEAYLISEQYGSKIDLLVTDVVMPRMSGKQLADRLAPLRPDMRVLFMSGYTENTIVKHGVLDPGIAFIQKPVTPNLLLRRVREVLDATRTQ